MRKRLALLAVVACGAVALTPTAAGAKSSPLCFKHRTGSLNIQIGYCP